ncbi:MAG TPA: G1 family glutamic endopeptidase [Acidimicrobiales bacterium]|nr:G1 family glutamic endopeptidase [Acidimicrobiales bacterium]
MRESARRMLVSAVCVLGLAAAAAPVLSTAAATPAAAASAAAGSTSLPTPGLYHQPIIGKVVLPGLGQVLGHGLRHVTNVQSQNWSGYADNQDTYDSVAASWTQPAVNCSAGGGVGGGVLNGLLGGNGLGNLLGPGSSAASFWVGLDGYASNSVEQLGADSDCNGKTPMYYAWWEMFPNPSQVLSSAYPVHPGDQMTAWVASNGSGTTFYLALKDTTAGWFFGTTQNASPGFGRSSAEVVAEAPSSCNILFCSEVPLSDFGQVGFGNADLIDNSGNNGSLAAFNANAITMAVGNRTLAVPSNLSADGRSFSVSWQNS